MPLTSQQIRDRAANELGILTLGESLQDQDKVRIQQAYSEVYEYLKTKGLAAWAIGGNAPDDVAPYVIVMVAHNCLETYGVSNDRYTRITTRFATAEKQIRELTTLDVPPQGDPTDF